MQPREKAVRKYLARHAEPEAARVHACLTPNRHYGHVLCVPAYGEGDGLLESLATLPPGPRGAVLIVVVVNEPASAPAWAREANRRSLAALRGRGGESGDAHDIELHSHPRGDLLVIDRTHSGACFPDGQGVGLARKIGADVALSVWAAGRLASPWIHCSDADVSFPMDYFHRPLIAAGDALLDEAPSAFVYDFRHRVESDPDVARAALRYEIFLRYYVLGLRNAGSPYAFHTIGSTLAISPLGYAQARGFPRRKAAEDFHMLAKLAKLGPVRELRGDPILLSGRVSARVPFGTGAGIAKELERMEAGSFYPAYDPRIFMWLAVWLDTLSAQGGLSGESEASLRDGLVARADATSDVDGALLLESLTEFGAIERAETGRGRGARHLHEQFDALATLRFIHHLRDHRFPSLPLERALRTAPFIALDGYEGDFDSPDTCERLARLEAQRTAETLHDGRPR